MKNILFVFLVTLVASSCNPLGSKQAPEEPSQPRAEEPSPSQETASNISTISEPLPDPEPSAPSSQREVAEPRPMHNPFDVDLRISMAQSTVDKSLGLSIYEANRSLPAVDLDCDPAAQNSWNEITNGAERQKVLALADQFHSEHKVIGGFSEDHEPDYGGAVVYGYNSLDFSQFTEDVCELSIRTQCAPGFGENRENGWLIEISWHPYGSQKGCRENERSNGINLDEICCDETDAYLDGHRVQTYRYYVWSSEDFEEVFGAAFDWNFGGAISKQPMKFNGYRRGDDGQILVEGEFLWGSMLPRPIEDLEHDSFQGVFDSKHLKIIYRKSDQPLGVPRKHRESIPFRGEL